MKDADNLNQIESFLALRDRILALTDRETDAIALSAILADAFGSSV